MSNQICKIRNRKIPVRLHEQNLQAVPAVSEDGFGTGSILIFLIFDGILITITTWILLKGAF